MITDLELIWRMRTAAKSSGKIPMFVAGGQAAQLNYKQWLDLGIDLIVNGYGEETFHNICKNYLFFHQEFFGNQFLPFQFHFPKPFF